MGNRCDLVQFAGVFRKSVDETENPSHCFDRAGRLSTEEK